MTDAATQAHHDQALLDDRYGRRRLSRRGKIALATAGIVLAAGAVGYYGWQTVVSASNTVDVDDTGFVADNAHSVTVSFQTTARRGSAITCAIEAMDVEHGAVGWRIVEYPASDEHTRAFREEIPTVAEATTGLVRACWIP